MRIRIKFTKNGALRYIGHLDLHKMWERATRRANIPLQYSQGFHPQPKIQLASALPLGFSSRCELVDMWVAGEVDLGSLPDRLTRAVPPGLGILMIESIDEKSPPLQTVVVSSQYEITIFDEIGREELADRAQTFLARGSVLRERRGKPYDLRPLVEEMRVDVDSAGRPRLFVQMAAREGATGRPEELLDELGLRYEDARVERCGFLFR